MAVGLAGSAASVAYRPAYADRGSTALLSDTTLEPGLVLLNAANLTPAFRVAQEAMEKLARSVREDPSFQNRDRFQEMSEAVRAQLAAFVGAPADGIALLRNCSEANNLIAHGLALSAGDEVIVFDQNHQSNRLSWQARATREGIVVRDLPTPIDAQSEADIIAPIAAAITPRTRVIAVSEISNRSGLEAPVRKLAEFAEAHDIWLHIDGAQGFGWRPLDLQALGCTSYSASAHKWMLGPIEAGFLYVQPNALERVASPIQSVNYWLSHGATPQGARRFEALGQRDDARLAGIAATIARIEEIGLQVIEQEVRALTDYLRMRLGELPEVRVGEPGSPGLFGPIVRAYFDTPRPVMAAQRMWDAKRIALTPGAGSLRFSPHAYNTRAEIDLAVGELAEAIRA